ncbi:MAG: M48 family metalloprotease, partial [Burkholderiaceae bacterium]
MSGTAFASRCFSTLLAAVLCCAPPWAGAQTQFDNLPRLGDAGADELAPGAERRIGETIVRDLRRQGQIHDDAELTDYLNRFAVDLTSTTPAAGYSFEFFLVRDNTLNAFALPGGYIGVHTGLIVAAQSESELAGVLAHEIGHVTQRHIARMLARERQTSVMMLATLVLAALAARSNPQATVGIAALGGTMQQQQMLSFSRDAEREADRIGLDILRQAGFDANGMVGFFGRLQQAGRLYENNAPEYLRTHPMTSARIADIQSRVGATRYRQRADSFDFMLARAKLRALSDTGVDGLRLTRALFERQLRERTLDETAGRFGLATVLAAQRDAAGARKEIAELRRRLPDGHPFVERLAAQVEIDAGDAAAAAALLGDARRRFPSARALIHQQARVMMMRHEYREAVATIEEALGSNRGDPEMWRLLSEAQGGLGQPARAHRAAAEQFVLLGALPAAIEQLRIAQRTGGSRLDFYTASQIDSRLR